MFFGWFDAIFSFIFPILFLLFIGMFFFALISNLRTWNKNNHSPRLTVPATVVAKRTEVSHHHRQYDGAYVHDLLCDLSGRERRPHGAYRKWFGLRNACGGRHR